MAGNVYRYRLVSTGGSSDKYGPCEVCGKHATEVFQQVEELQFEEGWTQHGCRRLFGHAKCLASQRRGRLKWLRDGKDGGQRSACERFVIRSTCMNPKWWGYWGLTDLQTGTEYPCRTEASAKVAARNLRQSEGGA